MGFSVVGLPHYTIWHLYEPSVDDLRRMEEMEEERKAREQEEQALSDWEERARTSSTGSEGESNKDGAVVNVEKGQQYSDSPERERLNGEEDPAVRSAEGDSGAAGGEKP